MTERGPRVCKLCGHKFDQWGFHKHDKDDHWKFEVNWSIEINGWCCGKCFFSKVPGVTP